MDVWWWLKNIQKIPLFRSIRYNQLFDYFIHPKSGFKIFAYYLSYPFFFGGGGLGGFILKGKAATSLNQIIEWYDFLPKLLILSIGVDRDTWGELGHLGWSGTLGRMFFKPETIFLSHVPIHPRCLDQPLLMIQSAPSEFIFKKIMVGLYIASFPVTSITSWSPLAIFLVACTRLYTSLCRSVGRSVGNHFAFLGV